MKMRSQRIRLGSLGNERPRANFTDLQLVEDKPFGASTFSLKICSEALLNTSIQARERLKHNKVLNRKPLQRCETINYRQDISLFLC